MNFYLVHFTYTINGKEYDDTVTIMDDAAHKAAKRVVSDIVNECRVNEVQTLPRGIWAAANRMKRRKHAAGGCCRELDCEIPEMGTQVECSPSLVGLPDGFSTHNRPTDPPDRPNETANRRSPVGRGFLRRIFSR